MSDYMFRLQNTDMLEADLNDFQHKVERLIRDHKDEAGFPMLDTFRLEQEELDDYLFERQAILDSKGSERSRYTVAGFLIALPVIVISAFPEESLPWGRHMEPSRRRGYRRGLVPLIPCYTEDCHQDTSLAPGRKQPGGETFRRRGAEVRHIKPITYGTTRFLKVQG